MAGPKIEVENVNVPGHKTNVDLAKYEDMKQAMLKVLPTVAPGMTAAEINETAKQHLDETLFPGGKTSGWWAKTVQLDLEAKEIMKRSSTKPLRWYLG